MGSITRDCPHCHSRNNTFTAFANIKDPNYQTNQTYLTAFSCGSCCGGYFAKIKLHAAGYPVNFPGDIDKNGNMSIMEEYPKPITLETPQYLPTNIESFFIQAAESLNNKNFDASSMMSRKVLEVAVKSLNPSESGNLYSRIEQLHSQGKITDDLKDWAHIIRDDGNEAAHEAEPVNLAFADELLSFTKLFLLYTFTMPEMVKNKKGLSENSL